MSSASTGVLDRCPDITELPEKVRCCYVNEMQRTQIIRIVNIPHDFLERTVLPGDHLVFETYPDAELEVHTYEMASATLTAKIICDRLAIPTVSETTRMCALYKELNGG
ncbi:MULTISPECIES: DUF1830 domain-containing protein [unclassified Acaryochloris]|uniref:DUF1830 domain-containing protein n=1 Tax=unclassified Acaryochloris TaxID=2631661 RepID=UPI001F409C55|nr:MULTISPECIES: DUF1830 domain-containing protein [unclassified Acaryochloris]